MDHQYAIDGKAIKLTITLTQRNTSVVVVKPDLSVEYKGAVDTPIQDIYSAIEKKIPLLRKKLAFFQQFHPLPTAHNYESGETFYYLGRQYRLKLVASEQAFVKLVGRWFLVCIPDTADKYRIEMSLDKWYKDKAVKRITERYLLLQELVANKIDVFPELSFRKMKKRWGSCSSKRIMVNTELIKTPIACIDYIIVHELCHLLYPKHNKLFFHKLTRLMPDWKTRKMRLEHSNIV